MPTNKLPIPIERIKQLAYLPCKLTELSYVNEEAAFQLLRAWGEGRMPITHLWNETLIAIDEGKSNVSEY
ncbi:hypothetical protein M5X11_17495 [Paenibacillus alginolyticus]|uniref:hypothetical protein n=1 Tax=Paenibacillus alginolyticus TaxID=59839 RepID=UPI00049251E1|nr:hypothetical protein [Paenibacillus alginolyticus]MCY9666700.1 hypothetical protein [Paenibacillus alginolyticus]